MLGLDSRGGEGGAVAAAQGWRAWVLGVGIGKDPVGDRPGPQSGYLRRGDIGGVTLDRCQGC